MKASLKMKTTSKIGLHPKISLSPPLPLKSYLTFFRWLLTLTATRQLMSYRICYQVSKPEMEFHMMDIIYAAHVRTNRKDNILMQRWLGQIFICILEWGKGLVKNQDCTRPELTQPKLCLLDLCLRMRLTSNLKIKLRLKWMPIWNQAKILSISSSWMDLWVFLLLHF